MRQRRAWRKRGRRRWKRYDSLPPPPALFAPIRRFRAARLPWSASCVGNGCSLTWHVPRKSKMSSCTKNDIGGEVAQEGEDFIVHVGMVNAV